MTNIQKKIMDVKPPKGWTRRMRLAYHRRHIRKFFINLETKGGIVGNRAVLFRYNKDRPELSYIITEKI